MAATLPLAEVDFTFSIPAGGTTYTPAPGNITSLVATLNPGDVLLLQAGGTYQIDGEINSGKDELNPIYCMSDAHESLPPPGERVSPDDAANMAIIQGDLEWGYGNDGGWRVVGCHIKPINDSDNVNALVWADYENKGIIIDRCWIEGGSGTKCGIKFCGENVGAIGCYINNIRGSSSNVDEYIGIQIWRPRISSVQTYENCYVEASNCGICVGGESGRDIEDITIRGCDITKNPAWEGVHTNIGAGIELRRVERCLIEACKITNCWYQTGSWSSSGYGLAVWNPWTGSSSNLVEDATFRLSRIQDCHNGIFLLGDNVDSAAKGTRRVDIEDIIIETNPEAGRGSGYVFEFRNGVGFSPDDITIKNVTAMILSGTGQDIGTFSYSDCDPKAANLIFINCVADAGINGFKGIGTPEGTLSLNNNFDPWQFEGNVIIGGAGTYPVNNALPSSRADVKFEDFPGGNYRIAPDSPYKNYGTDGEDPGADIQAVEDALGESPPAGPVDVDLTFNNNAIVSYQMEVNNIPSANVDLSFNDNAIVSFEMLVEEVILEEDIDTAFNDNTITSYEMQVIGEVSANVNLTFNDNTITSYAMLVEQIVTSDIELLFNNNAITSYPMEVIQQTSADIDVVFNNNTITGFVMDVQQELTSSAVELEFNDNTITEFDMDVIQGGVYFPELPREQVDTTYSLPVGGTTWTVNDGDDLQTALNNAALGDVIILEAGATWTGPYILPNKGPGTDWIYVQSSGYANLPGPGNRVSPYDAADMPTILTPAGTGFGGIYPAADAHHWRFVGIEFRPVVGDFVYNVVDFTDPSDHMILDRCYLHGNPSEACIRGVQLDSAHGAAVDCYFSEFLSSGNDTQAVLTIETPGPIKVHNCYLEATGENFMAGGADPSITDRIPSDITFTKNLLVKRLGWQGVWTQVKNLFELKNARRVLVEGNVMANNWAAAQPGFAVVITPRNQDNGASWSAVEDITFRLNRIHNSAQGFNLQGADDVYVSETTNRVLIEDVLLTVNTDLGGSGRIFQFLGNANGPPENVTVQNVTAFISGSGSSAMAFCQINPKSPGFTFRDQIVDCGDFGFIGTDSSPGTDTLDTHFVNWVWTNNVCIATQGGTYPPNNSFPADYAAVGFVDFDGGDYRLDAGSPYKDSGTDGTDPGCDIDALEAAIDGVIRLDVTMEVNDNTITSYNMEVAQDISADVNVQFNDNTITSFAMDVDQVTVSNVNLVFNINTILNYVMEVEQILTADINVEINDNTIFSYEMEADQVVVSHVDTEFNDNTIVNYELLVLGNTMLEMELNDNTIQSFIMDVNQNVGEPVGVEPIGYGMLRKTDIQYQELR